MFVKCCNLQIKNQVRMRKIYFKINSSFPSGVLYPVYFIEENIPCANEFAWGPNCCHLMEGNFPRERTKRLKFVIKFRNYWR